MNGHSQPMIPLACLYENQSAKTGKTYYVGYLGKAKLVMLCDDRAAEGQPQWTLFLAERPEKAGTPARLPARSRTSSPRPDGKGAAHERPFDDPIGL